MFFKRRKRNTNQEVYEVYVVGRPSPYNDVVKVIGVTRTREDAEEICIDYVRKVTYREHELEVHRWDDCINIRVELATGIIRSYTFNISRHDLK